MEIYLEWSQITNTFLDTMGALNRTLNNEEFIIQGADP